MNLIVYGLIFVGVGIFQLVRERRLAKEVHMHKCPKCGERWAHKRLDEYPTARAAVEAHTCPKCRAEAFEIDAIGALASAEESPARPAPRPAAPPAVQPTKPAPAPPAQPAADKTKPS